MDISHAPAPARYSGLAFADLIAPLSTEDFFKSYAGKKPIHIPGPADKFTFAMSWDHLNRILNQTAIWTPHTLQLVLDTNMVRPDQYSREGFGRDGNLTLLADFEKVRTFLRHGASLVLNEIETLNPGLKSIAEVLGYEPGGKVQGNLYCSWQKHQAFDVHYDTHDVFAMQVVGEKAWRIYQCPFKDPINHPMFKSRDNAFHRAHKGDLSMEFTMRPGDLVYVPRGFYHEALAESDATVHMSFSVVPLIGLDVVTMLFEHGVADDVFRQAVPHPDERGGAALDEYLMRMVGRMREMLRDPKVRDQIAGVIRNYRFPIERIDVADEGRG